MFKLFRKLNSTNSQPRSRVKPRFEGLEDRLSPAVDLSLTTIVSNPTPAQNGAVTYTVTVINHDLATDATGVSVASVVPNGYGTPSAISDGGSVVNGNDVAWSGLAVPANSSKQLTFTVTVGTLNTFVAPTNALGPKGWERPTSASAVATFQGWERFFSQTTPNAPNDTTMIIGPAFGGVTGNVWPTVNANGPATVLDTGYPANNAVLTGTNNIYSPSGVLAPHVVVPNNLDNLVGDNPNGWTTILLQVRLVGNTVDRNSVKLNGTISPVGQTRIATEVVPFQGDRETWAFQFQVPGNADVYTLDFSGASSNMSLDRVAVDTIWNATATSQAEAYSIDLPFAFNVYSQIVAAGQSDPDSIPNNGPAVDEDDDAIATLAVGAALPNITSNGGLGSATVNLPENSLAVTTVAATGGTGTITYSIFLNAGADNALFQIDASTGALRFLVQPNFESPTDAGADNVYEVYVKAADANGAYDLQKLSVTVTDVEPEVDLSLTSSVSNATPAQNGTVTYTVTVVNGSATDATGVSVASVVPNGYGTPSAISDGGSVVNGNDVAWSGLAVPANSSKQLTFTVTVGTLNTFVAPTNALGPKGWERPTSASAVATFQGWERFFSQTTPNAPNDTTMIIGPAFGGVAGNVWPTVNANGPATVLDTGYPANNAVLTGTNNIYSPSGVLAPHVVVPNNLDNLVGDNPNGWTTILLQVRLVGNTVDRNSVKLNGTISPVGQTRIATEVVPFQGDRETWAFQFQVPGNADVYTLDFSGASSNMSLDRVAVDTIWNATATSQAEAYSIDLPFAFNVYSQIVAAGQSDPDSIPNNGPAVDEDDDAIATLAVGAALPNITSNGGLGSATVNLPENSLAVTTVAATGGTGTITYSIFLNAGADNALFQIDASTGALRFLVQPNFESPTDAGADNVYEVYVKAADANGAYDLQKLSVTVTDVEPEIQVTSVAPFVGPTAGGNTVVIAGHNFLAATSVTFGSVAALSFTVVSESQITAVAPAGAPATVDVMVSDAAGSSYYGDASDNYTYLQPAITSVVVNGGVVAAKDRFGGTPALANQFSVVSQILVEFNQKVTLDADAFSITSLAGLVSAQGATPSTADVAVIATGVGDGVGGYVQYVLTFASGAGVNSFDNSAVSPALGNAFTTLKDGLFQLNAVGSKIHGGPLATGTDSSERIWSLYGTSNPGDVLVASPLGGGDDTLLVDGLALNDLYATFGSSANVPTPAYNAAFDWNLDGSVDGIELSKLYANFGTIWKF